MLSHQLNVHYKKRKSNIRIILPDTKPLLDSTLRHYYLLNNGTNLHRLV